MAVIAIPEPGLDLQALTWRSHIPVPQTLKRTRHMGKKQILYFSCYLQAVPITESTGRFQSLVSEDRKPDTTLPLASAASASLSAGGQGPQRRIQQ